MKEILKEEATKSLENYVNEGSVTEEIIYQFTVEDTDLYKQSWTAELSFYPLEGRIYEYACHEGNYSMPGILAGARRAEREQASN